MPSEVSDIKQFIEICRRKDASCTSTTSFPVPKSRGVGIREKRRRRTIRE